MKRVICALALLMWIATLCVWYKVNEQKNRYIVTSGHIIDLKKQRYLKVDKKNWKNHWEKLMDTADEQIDQFGKVVFDDHDYRFLKRACRLSADEWDYAVSAEGSGKEIFKEIKARRKYAAEEVKAYEKILSMSIDNGLISANLSYFMFAVDMDYISWQSILSRLNAGDKAYDISKEIRRIEDIHKRLFK